MLVKKHPFPFNRHVDIAQQALQKAVEEVIHWTGWDHDDAVKLLRAATRVGGTFGEKPRKSAYYETVRCKYGIPEAEFSPLVIEVEEEDHDDPLHRERIRRAMRMASSKRCVMLKIKGQFAWSSGGRFHDCDDDWIFDD